MELVKSSICITSFFLLVLLALPCVSRGTKEPQVADSDVYEIDYRGPETHSSALPLPPPAPSHHGRFFLSGRTNSKESSKGNGENDKKIHE